MVIDEKTDSTSAIDDPIEKSDRIDDVPATHEEEKVTKEVVLVRYARALRRICQLFLCSGSRSSTGTGETLRASFA